MKSSAVFGRYVVPAIYSTIVVAALVVDFFTDRSGGALALATLPIAAAAAGCFIYGQFTAKREVKWLFLNWMLGAGLVLLGFLAFAMKGGEAPKEGELIFTLAMLLTAPPASFVLPLVPSTSVGHALDEVMLRSTVGWVSCLVAASVQWIAVRWLMRQLRSQRSAD